MFNGLRKKHSRQVGVDISGRSIKLLELVQHGNSYRVEGFAVASLPANAVVEYDIRDHLAVGDAIRAAKKRSMTRASEAAVAVYGSSVIIKELMMD